MEDEFEVIEPKTETPEKVSDISVDDIFAGYAPEQLTEERKEPETENPSNIPETSEPLPSSVNLPENHWVNDPRYFQTGKKAGQLKPSAMGNKSQPKTAQPEPKEIKGMLINGALLLTLTDLLFPMLIAGGNNIFTKKKIAVQDIQLTDSQKSELAPVAKQVADYMQIHLPPLAVYAFTVGSIYMVNFAKAKAKQ